MFFRHRLMNEAVEISSDGNASASLANDYSSKSIISENDDDIFKSFGLDASKYGLDDSQDEAPAAESQGSEDSQEAGQETDENAFLERINALGAIHNELPVKIESLADLKNLVQMGKDYTVKTQSLSEERKAWDSEKSSAEKELNGAIEEFNNAQKAYGTQLQEMQQWTFALNQLKTDAPDIFDEVQRAYEGTVKQFSNPVLDQQLAAIRAELAETKKGLSQREDKLIVDSFESEYSALSALEQSAKELGISVNKDDVKKKWAETGMKAEDAFGLLYGKMAMQAQASKSKVETTRQKVAAKPTGGASASRPGSKAPAIDSKLTGMAYASALLDRYKN